MFFLPEQVIAYLKEEAAKGASKEEWIRGRKVSVKFQAITEIKEKSKLKAIGQVLAGSLWRLREPRGKIVAKKGNDTKRN